MDQVRMEEVAVAYCKHRALIAAKHKIDHLLANEKVAAFVPDFVKEKAHAVVEHKISNHCTREKAGEFALLYVKRKLASKKMAKGENVKASVRKKLKKHRDAMKESGISEAEVMEFIRALAPKPIQAALAK